MAKGQIYVDFTPVVQAIYKWLNYAVNGSLSATGEEGPNDIPILKSEYDGPRPDNETFIEFSYLTGLSKLGSFDEIRGDPDSPTTFKLVGQRNVTITISVIGSTKGNEILAQIQQSLSSPPELAILQEAGLAVRNDEAFTDAAIFQETLFEDRVVMDVIFGLTLVRDIDIGLIEKVQMSSDIPAGQDIIVDKFQGDISSNTSLDGDEKIAVFPVGKKTLGFPYAVLATFKNTVDTNPQIFPVGIVKKTSTAFKGIWSGDVDSANYEIEYLARISQMIGSYLDVEDGIPIPKGAQQLTVRMSQDMIDEDYVPVPCIVNLKEGSPALFPLVVTMITKKRFTVKFPLAIPNENYALDFFAKHNSVNIINRKQWRSGLVNLTQGSDSAAVNFATAFADTGFRVAPILINLVDASPQVQNMVLSSKSATGFSVNFEAAIDTANQKLGFIARKDD